MNVRLISHTPNPDELCSEIAQVCYSDKKFDEIKTNTKLLRNVIDSGHLSVIEHANFTFVIEGVSRVTTHQLVRHRIASYCVSGSTKIRTSSQKTNNKTISELYDLPSQYSVKLQLRCVDENTGEIKYNHPIDIVKAGVKPTYTVKTIHGYSIRTTLEHKFLTENGWKSLKEISVGDRVYINGIALYKDKDWLSKKYNEECLTQQQIADLCGVSKNCIRKWVRIFNLQKELGSWGIGKEPPNKGRTKYDYEPMMRTSQKMRGNHNDTMFRRGPDKIGSWKEDNVSESGLRGRTARNCYPARKNICELCGFVGDTEFHHMNKNLEEYDSNLLELCVSCHKAIHRREITQKIVLSEVVEITYYGDEDTYDVIMPDPNHNYIADGFVVHNSQQSQRYVKMEDTVCKLPSSVELVVDGDSDANNAFIKLNESLDDMINILRKFKVPEEDIRYFFFNATETNIVVTMNARELLHFFELRCCNRAQWEIRQMAKEMLIECKKVAPVIFEKAGAPCEYKSCPEGKRSCRRVKK